MFWICHENLHQVIFHLWCVSLLLSLKAPLFAPCRAGSLPGSRSTYCLCSCRSWGQLPLPVFWLLGALPSPCAHATPPRLHQLLTGHLECPFSKPVFRLPLANPLEHLLSSAEPSSPLGCHKPRRGLRCSPPDGSPFSAPGWPGGLKPAVSMWLEERRPTLPPSDLQTSVPFPTYSSFQSQAHILKAPSIYSDSHEHKNPNPGRGEPRYAICLYEYTTTKPIILYD